MNGSIPPKGSTELLEQVLNIHRSSPDSLRPKTADGKPGALLDFRGVQKQFFLLGDLHANVHNFKCILETDDLTGKLNSGEAVLLMVGDIVHDDRTGYLTQMEPSIELLELVMEAMVRWPQQVFFLQGNHDTFNPMLVKSGIKQGKLFDEFLVKERSQQYRDLIGEIFDTLPLFAMADQFLMVHAGPIRGGCTREHLIEVRRYESDAFQLMWNRINTIGSVANNKEYTEDDIIKTRQLLEVSPDIYFVVGHNPLFERGGDESVWFNVMGAKNYIILYSGVHHLCPILRFTPDKPDPTVLYADLKITQSRFVLGDIY